MKKTLCILLLSTLAFAAWAAGAQEDASKPIVMVWLPNESGDDIKGARDAIGAVVEKALGRKVTHKLTTDYNIAIEAIANKQAHIAFFGAAQYLLSNAKSSTIQPLVVNSGSSGTLSDARYFSWLNVKLGNEGMYKSGAEFSIDNIKGKKFSWVSTSSTSGFKVPSAGMISYFNKKGMTLKPEDLQEGGSDKFFSEVLYGASHQGSAVNLLTGKVDLAAFCDACVANYVELVSGTDNTEGAVYQVSQDAAEPFTDLKGEKFVVIDVIPVLNAPFVVDTSRFSADQLKALRDAMTSDSTTKNEGIFVPKGGKGLFQAGQRFVAVEDAWFTPLRATVLGK